MVRQLHGFQQARMGSPEELRATAGLVMGPKTRLAAGCPGQEQLRSIKSQQTSVSREREKRIQGI